MSYSRANRAPSSRLALGLLVRLGAERNPNIAANHTTALVVIAYF